MIKVRRALASVTDKTGLVEFAKGLQRWNIELLSTGGTARLLRDNGLSIVEVSDYTGFPEMLDGRVKTLHPKIHGGILGVRDNPEHAATMEEHGIGPIDMVVVNLYAFRETIAKPDCTLEMAIENIDIGGPTLIRAAAKNCKFVAVVTDPADYGWILEEMEANDGALSRESRLQLAKKAFCLTHSYDGAICDYLDGIVNK